MSRARQVTLIIVAQIGCVAIGLWMQHHYVLSSVRTAEEQDARQSFFETAETVVASAHGRDASVDELAALDFDRLQRALDRVTLPRSQTVLLVDARWKVMHDASTRTATRAGELTRWTPDPAEAAESDGPMSGTLAVGDGEYLAVAYAVQRREGYLVLAFDQAAIASRVAASTESLPLSSVLAALWTCALLSITAFMIMARLHDQIHRERAEAEGHALRQIQTLVRTRDAVIFGLAKLADSRDPETGEHLERIAIYSSTLASALREHPKYAGVIDPNFVRLIGISSALHDIGKVGIADRILLKPGRLTTEERADMQKHTLIGGDCLRKIEQRLGSSNFLEMAREIALSHHERWDGTGYPNRLSGDAIPLAARIVAIADVYDALSSRRVYKDAIPHAECVEQIRKGAGTQFDPDLVGVWLKIADQYRDMARRYTGRRESETKTHRDEFKQGVRSEEPQVVVASGV